MSETYRVRGLAVPGGLVHPHVHLDKCYLLDRTPIQDGSFQEAMRSTSKAKADFSEDDIYTRGKRLIEGSLKHGVLAMRAHVEVDPTVGHKCLEAGKRLKMEFASRCQIQLVAFAQDPLYYPGNSEKQQRMQNLIQKACREPNVAAVGSAPYVESAAASGSGATSNVEAQRKNIVAIFDFAQSSDKDVDFHLDYNIDQSTEPLLWFVLEEAHRRCWSRHICIGHATRMSLFDEAEWDRVKSLCEGLNVTFVGLPPSDIYMQGRSEPYSTRSRATLPLMECTSRSLSSAIGVNNVANLFTPQGDGDPLALLPLVVGLWQCATPDALISILSMVASSAQSIVRDTYPTPAPCLADVILRTDGSFVSVVKLDKDTLQERGPADFDTFTLLVGSLDVQQAVLSPPTPRLAIRQGKLVSWRRIDEGIAAK